VPARPGDLGNDVVCRNESRSFAQFQNVAAVGVVLLWLLLLLLLVLLLLWLMLLHNLAPHEALPRQRSM
jgi:hypothetical protein